jgi:hypothetical protein
MFNADRGEGEDWPKAQALGLTIDPHERAVPAWWRAE